MLVCVQWMLAARFRMFDQVEFRRVVGPGSATLSFSPYIFHTSTSTTSLDNGSLAFTVISLLGVHRKACILCIEVYAGVDKLNCTAAAS